MNRIVVSTATVLDSRAALTRLGGDADLYSDLIGFFLVDAPELIQDLWKAVEAEDPKEIRMKAHALKGLIAGCGGLRAMGVAQSIENVAQSGDPEELPALVQSLEEEVECLTRSLLPYRKGA
jgi:HPt (histidine-containing phosphotransfer) domain-containing protein